MGIDNAHRLEIGINNCGAHKGHPTALQVFGHRIGQGRAGRAGLVNHLAVCPVPEVAGKTAPFPLNFPEYLCVVHRGLDFPAVADDARVLCQGSQLVLLVSAYRVQVKAVKGLPESVPFIEHTGPGQAGLKALQDEHFKEFLVVMDRHAPLLVVVAQVPLVVWVCPAAAGFSVCPFHCDRLHLCGTVWICLLTEKGTGGI